MKSDYYQRLDRFRKETIIAWVQARGFSFCIEELEGVEQREEPARLAAIARQIEAEWIAKTCRR